MTAQAVQPPAAAAPPQNLDAESSAALAIAWAAGLFEGEGCLSIKRDRVPTISLAMTDCDVVERFHAIIGCGAVYTRQPRGCKPVWNLNIVKTDDVVRVIELLRPYFGDRRRARADELLAAVRVRIDDATVERECPRCHGIFRPPFTSNAMRRRFCSKRCRSNWHSCAARERQKVARVGH